MDDITWTDTGSLMPRKLDAPGKEGKRAFSSYNIDRSGIDDASKFVEGFQTHQFLLSAGMKSFKLL